MTARGRCALLIFFAFLLGPFSALAQTPTPTDRQILVREIAVQGNRRVQEAVILGRVGAKIGSPFVANRTAEDIRAIFSLGFFDDVQVKVEDFEGGVKLTYMVVERPFVRDIVFAGNKKEDSATLQEKIELKLGSVYNPVEVNKGADKLKEYYEQEGYFEVGITPEIEKLADGDVTVTYRIAEGRRISIDQIVIEGAQGLTPKQVKGAMDTQEREYVVLRGTVQRQRLDEDVDRIIQLYNDHGYVQARVESSEIQVDREKARATIRIVVVEGPQFKVGGVDVMGNAVLPVEEIRRRIELKTGEVLSRSKLRDSVKGITDLYSAVGRASADVSPNTLQDTPGRLVNIVFEINEGPETYVERINISGNTRSEEKILRREIPMAEGDLFTSQKLARAKQKLTNLNYFDKVEAKTAPGSAKDKIIVNIDVTEKPTGLFSIGGGYSSQDRHHRLHRALSLPPAPLRRLRHLQHPPHPARLHGQLPGWRYPARAPPRGVLALERNLPGQPGSNHQRQSAWQPRAHLPGGDPSHVPGRAEPLPRHPRQRLRPDPGQHRLARGGLRGHRLRGEVCPQRLLEHLLPAPAVARSRPELPVDGGLFLRLEQGPGAALRALLPGRLELSAAVQVPPGLPQGRHRHPDRRQQRTARDRRVGDRSFLRDEGRG